MEVVVLSSEASSSKEPSLKPDGDNVDDDDDDGIGTVVSSFKISSTSSIVSTFCDLNTPRNRAAALVLPQPSKAAMTV